MYGRVLGRLNKLGGGFASVRGGCRGGVEVRNRVQQKSKKDISCVCLRDV